VKIAFPDPTELSPPIINVKDISFKYAEGLPTLFTKVDFGLDMQSRVSMVGPNGVGKSTLLSLILGKWLVVGGGGGSGGGFTVVVVLQWWWFYRGGGFTVVVVLVWFHW
jgi:ATPase subunit of ABC transporter with duplicated ATPase domains